MPRLSNSPAEATLLELEQRKSFSLGVLFADHNENRVDLTAATARLSVGRNPRNAYDPPELLVEVVGTPVPEQLGAMRFDLQASDLDLDEGSYPYVITLTTTTGYSAVVVKGEVKIVPNPDTAALDETFTAAETANTLDVTLRSQQVDVDVAYVVLAGEGFFTQAEREKLAGIEAGAQVNPDLDAFTQQLVDLLYPVGSLWLTVADIDPNARFGGTWVRFGQGHAVVGVDETDPDFDEPEATFGEKEHLLSAAESGVGSHSHALIDPGHVHVNNAHTHTINNATVASSDHRHALSEPNAWADITIAATSAPNVYMRRISAPNWTATHQNGFSGGATTSTFVGGTAAALGGQTEYPASVVTISAQSTTPTMQVGYTGLSVQATAAAAAQAHNNVQPSVAVYIWKRTA